MNATPIHRLTVEQAIALLVKADVHVDQTDEQRVVLANARLTRAETYQFPEAFRTVIGELDRLSTAAPGSDAHVRLLRTFDRNFDL